MQVQAAASAAAVAAAAGSRQNKPRPIAPALSVAKVTAAGTPGESNMTNFLCLSVTIVTGTKFSDFHNPLPRFSRY